MKQIALSEIKDNLPRFLREAASERIVITRHGRPAGILVGFATDDDWIDYRLEHDPRFLSRIATARADIRAGRGVRLEDLDAALKQPAPTNDPLSRPTVAVTPSRPHGAARKRRARQSRRSAPDQK